MRKGIPLLPAGILGAGCLLLLLVGRQQTALLRAPLTQLPDSALGYAGRDVAIDSAERRVAGVSDYLLRLFEADSTPVFSLYVGYYRSQVQGQSIHSPKNCLPGAGWEPMSASIREVTAAGRGYPVNRYLIANGPAQALVYYWYQGRGRVSAGELRVKWELLRDKALTGRSEEALVRIVVPLRGSEADADSVATRATRQIIPALFDALPAFIPAGHEPFNDMPVKKTE